VISEVAKGPPRGIVACFGMLKRSSSAISHVIEQLPDEAAQETVEEAGDRARCGVKTIYREVRAGRLKAARVGGRRELRLLSTWVDEWLL
jgi:excisionase family DNA binding protein